MTKIDKTIKDINDLWLFYVKTAKLRKALLLKKKPKKGKHALQFHRPFPSGASAPA
jgi:hypothetical protein